MKKFKIIAGVFWAFLCLVMVLVLFPGLNGFAGSIARLPFMKINPNMTGGTVDRQIMHDQYSTEIRKPVFDGLTRERQNGFVQIDWRGTLPDEIYDTIDYNNDQKPDFTVHIVRSTDKTEIVTAEPSVGKVLVSTPVSYGWALRVSLTK